MHAQAAHSPTHLACPVNPPTNFVTTSPPQAMRNNFAPSPLNSDVFSIANPRIQSAMSKTIAYLRCLGGPASAVVANLTSCKFVTSWDESAAVLTLSYSDAIPDPDEWKLDAFPLLQIASLASVTARFKGRAVSVGEAKHVIRDTLDVPQTSPPRTVFYHKPADAFQHPNRSAMLTALSWLVGRIDAIVEARGGRVSMLEMYCGCGAHSIALATEDRFTRIKCVEVDARLVDSCKGNVALNELGGLVSVVKGDAGEVARRMCRQGKGKKDVEREEYDVLLVDPPRQGLDQHVRRLAEKGRFTDFLYVSCGREALVRDLNGLLDSFDVVDVAITDLFPRTDSVETLVHLRRRGKNGR